MQKSSPVRGLIRRAGLCQAGSGWRPVSRALYMRARDMAYCTRIDNVMINDAHMLSMHHNMRRGLLRKSLCARACRRGVVLMNNGVF